jgi:hypothetical protein
VAGELTGEKRVPLAIDVPADDVPFDVLRDAESHLGSSWSSACRSTKASRFCGSTDLTAKWTVRTSLNPYSVPSTASNGVPVYERFRLTVRAEQLMTVEGRLEHREGVINVVATAVHRLERPDMPLGEIRHIEPRRAWSTEEDAGNLRAVLPAAHSFGRRG